MRRPASIPGLSDLGAVCRVQILTGRRRPTGAPDWDARLGTDVNGAGAHPNGRESNRTRRNDEAGRLPDRLSPDRGEREPGQAPLEPTQAEPTQAEIDQGLMRRVAEGRAEAVDELYDRFGSLVYRMAVQVLPNRAEAEDATQEVFVRLWKTAERYDSDRAALVTWVMLLTRRHLVDKLRRTKSRISAVSMDAAASLDPGTSDTTTMSLEERERFGKLMERISALPELQRMVVVRAYLGGQTLRQIGEELEIPLGTIKSALSRALVRLRERAAEERA